MAEAYFVQELANSSIPSYPDFPTVNYAAQLNRSVKHSILYNGGPHGLGRIVCSAWALLLAQHANTSDVLFGTTFGHSSHHALPLRVLVDWQAHAGHWLRGVQRSITAHEAYRTAADLDDIRRYNADTREACNFRSLVLLDYNDEATFQEAVRQTGNCIALALVCTSISNQTCTMCLHFDDKLLDTTQANRVIYQLHHFIEQLHSVAADTRLIELDLLCEQDKATIWLWNSCVPRENSTTVPRLFAQQVTHYTNRLAVEAWDGSLTYVDLDRQSTQLAQYLTATGVAIRGRPLPVCFDKTIWTTITISALEDIARRLEQRIVRLGATPQDWPSRKYPTARRTRRMLTG